MSTQAAAGGTGNGAPAPDDETPESKPFTLRTIVILTIAVILGLGLGAGAGLLAGLKLVAFGLPSAITGGIFTGLFVAAAWTITFVKKLHDLVD